MTGDLKMESFSHLHNSCDGALPSHFEIPWTPMDVANLGEKEIEKNKTILKDYERGQRIGLTEPEFSFNFDVANRHISIDRHGETLFRHPLSLKAIHALYHPTEKNDFRNGIIFRISKRDLATPLGFEAFLQVIMMNMISAVYPRLCSWAPARNHLPLMHIDAEVNYIRNCAFINSLSHVHILKDRFAGLPVLLALPGPSLDLDYIRHNRSRFALVAAGRASKVLLEAGIDPDVIYIQDINSQAWDTNFVSLSDRRASSILIANPAGRIWKYHHNFQRVYKAWNLYEVEKDVFPRIEEIAPSTTSGAYSIARLLGGSELLIMGNDSGTPVSPVESQTIPHSLTNMEFEEEGDELVFRPFKLHESLYLHYPESFSVTTDKAYIAGVQWLKMKALEDVETHGVRIYDMSNTRISQFNTPILDGSKYELGNRVLLPDWPYYNSSYDMVPFLKQKKSAYGIILRQLEKGIVPQSSKRSPYTSVLTGTLIAASDGEGMHGMDIGIAIANARYLLQNIAIALGSVTGKS